MGLDNLGLVEIQSIDKGPLGKVCSSTQPEPCGEDNIEMEFLSLREKEAGRKQQVDFHLSLTDSALVEEVSRYGPLSNSRGFRDSRSPSHSILFSFGRTPKREFFDHSGVIREAFRKGNLPRIQDAAGPSAIGNECWELVEFSGPISVARYSEGDSTRPEFQEGKEEKTLNWE